MQQSFSTIRRMNWDDTATSTQVVVQFFTWKDNGVSGSTAQKEVRSIVGYPVRVTTSKAFGGASGSFTITMKKPENLSSYHYLNLWADPENVWVLIQFVCDGLPMDVMLGMVDGLSSTFSREGMGQRDETYEIHGRDFGKAFEETQLYLNPFLPTPLFSYESVSSVTSQLLNATPAEFVLALTKSWIGGSPNVAQAWMTPPGLSTKTTLYDLLDTSGVEWMNPLTNGSATDLRYLNPEQDGGSLWDMLQMFSNGVLNELWVDLAAPALNPFAVSGLKPTLWLRERKFPTFREGWAKYAQLTTWKLPRNVVRARQVAKGGAASRFNYWMLYPQGFGSVSLEAFVQAGLGKAGEIGANPIFDEMSIRRHGLRRWVQTTPFMPWAARADANAEWRLGINGSPSAGMASAILAEWILKIHDWYVIAPKQLSGKITTTRVLPEVRIGQRVTEETEDGDVSYYVEGVDHTWQYPGTGQTNLTVTRGEYDKVSLLTEQYIANSPAAVTEALYLAALGGVNNEGEF